MRKSEVLAYFGNQSEVARALGITRMAVRQWPDDSVPMRRQYEIERITNGALKADSHVA